MEKYDIFISYRRSSYETANLIATRLKAAGYSVFFDMETLRSGKFNVQLYDVIDGCTDFVLVLPPGALDRCVNEDDWVRLETCRAMAAKKNIIPVMFVHHGIHFCFRITGQAKFLPEQRGGFRHGHGFDSFQNIRRDLLYPLAA